VRNTSSIRGWRWVWISALASAAVLATTLAGGAPKTGSTEPRPAAKAEKKVEKKAAAEKCQRDADCALVADDCCPCTAGGKQKAMARKHVDAYEKTRAQRCAGTMCAEMMSQDPSCSEVAVCEGGSCKLGPAKAK